MMGQRHAIGTLQDSITRSTPFISIVAPALNEAGNVHQLVKRTTATLEQFTHEFEIILVSDGSVDETRDVVRTLHQQDPRVKLLHLSRTFGHQHAILAGLDHADGRVVVTMDADLQHRPEAIPELLSRWELGADIVHAVRREPRRNSFLTRSCRRLAYGLLDRLCEVHVIPQSADFRLYDRRAVLAMRSLRERARFTRGLARWIGFRQDVVYVDEDDRHAGGAKYSFFKRFNLLLDGVFSLSSKPLQYLGVLGLFVSMLSGTYLFVILAGYAMNIPAFRAVSGWASIIAVVLCMGGLQMTGMWLMGQYMARTYDEVKRRPPYVISDAVGLNVPMWRLPIDDSSERRVIPRGSSSDPATVPASNVNLETEKREPIEV